MRSEFDQEGLDGVRSYREFYRCGSFVLDRLQAFLRAFHEVATPDLLDYAIDLDSAGAVQAEGIPEADYEAITVMLWSYSRENKSF